MRTPLATLGLLFVCACAEPPKALECSLPSECPAHHTCERGVCQESIRLVFVSPSAQVVTTRGQLTVDVDLEGPLPDAVELRVDGEPRLDLAAPDFAGTLDTASLSEEPHTLTAVARAGLRILSSQPKTLVVDRTAPAIPTLTAAAWTNASPVPVSGATEPRATVQMFEAGVALGAPLVADASGAFSVALALAEGAHELRATSTDPAGNASASSQGLVVNVDRTAPALVSRTPAPDASNIWSRDPIVVTFDEPLEAGSVGSATVRLSDGVGAEVQLAPPALSADGRTLTLAPASLPPVPNRLTLSLDGLLDRAGNRLPTSTWGWALPEWQEPRRAAFKPASASFDIAVSDDGDLAVALCDAYTGGALFLNWSRVGSRCSGSPVLVFDPAGRIVLGWRALDGVAHVERYAGTVKESLDGSVFGVDGSVLPTLAVDAAGGPIAAWVASDTLHVRRWDGSDWEPIQETSVVSNGTRPTLLGRSSAVLVAVGTSTGVSVLRVPSLSAPIESLTGASATLTADPTGLVYAATSSGEVFRWYQDPGGYRWSSVGPVPGADPVLVFRSAPGTPHLAALTPTRPPAAFLHSGSSWSPVGDVVMGPRTNSSPIRVAFGAGGHLAVSWAETYGDGADDIRVQRYNR